MGADSLHKHVKKISSVSITDEETNKLEQIFRNYIHSQRTIILRDHLQQILQLSNPEIFGIILNIFSRNYQGHKILEFKDFKELYYCFNVNNAKIKIILIAFLLFQNKETIKIEELKSNINLLFKKKSEDFNFLMEIENKLSSNNNKQNEQNKEISISRKNFIKICNNNDNISFFNKLKFIEKKFIGSSELNLLQNNSLNYVCDCGKKKADENIKDNMDDMKQGFDSLSTKGVMLLSDFEKNLHNYEINPKIIDLIIKYLNKYTQRDYCCFNDIKYIFSNLGYDLPITIKKKFLFKIISSLYGENNKVEYQKLYEHLDFNTNKQKTKEKNEDEINSDGKDKNETNTEDTNTDIKDKNEINTEDINTDSKNINEINTEEINTDTKNINEINIENKTDEINTDNKINEINSEEKKTNIVLYEEKDFLKDNNFENLIMNGISHLNNFGLLPYLLFEAKTNNKIIKRKLIKDSLINRHFDNHEKYLEKFFDSNDFFYIIDINFWNSLMNENEEVPNYINNSRIAEEINIVKEEDKYWQEENKKEEEENKEKKKNRNKKQKKETEKKKEKNNNEGNKEEKNKNKNNKEEEKNKEDNKEEENNKDNIIEEQIITKKGKLKKGLKYKKDFIILCDELYHILKKNYKIDLEIKITKINTLYLDTNIRISKDKKNENNNEEKKDEEKKDENKEEEKKDEENKKEEQIDKENKEEIKKNQEKEDEEYKIKENKALEKLNKFEIDIEKGIISKIIKDNNNNYISCLIDFYPIKVFESSFGEMVRMVEKAKTLYDDIEERKKFKLLSKREQKKLTKKKKKEEDKLIKLVKKVKQIILNYDMERQENLMTIEEYKLKIKELKKKYNNIFKEPDKTENDYVTDISMIQFKDNLQKYRNTIYLEKSDYLFTFSRFKTCKEVTEEIIMKNPNLKGKQFDVYYFFFNSKKLFKPNEDYTLEQEEKEENKTNNENDDFIAILYDIQNDDGLKFYNLLENKEKKKDETPSANDENEEKKEEKKEEKNEEKKEEKKEKNEEKKDEKPKKKEKIKKKEQEKKKEEKKKLTDEEKKKLKEKEKEEKLEKQRLEKERKEKEKELEKLRKEREKQEKEELKKRKQIEKEKERERERQKEKEKFLAPPYGIDNYGNTCYFNSVNQIFLNLPILQQIFLDPKIVYFINKNNKFGHQGKFFEIYKSLYWIKPSKIGDTVKSLKQMVGKLKEDFNNNEQQDANEYLNFVIENLHEEINLHSTKIYIEEKDDIYNHNTDEELGNISWANNLKRNTSFIDSIFMFQLKSNLKCKKCNTIKVKFETNYMFDLPLSLCKMVSVEVNLYRLPFRYKFYFNKINEKFDEYIKKDENKNLNIVKNLWNYYTNVLTTEEKKEHCIKLHFNFDLEREKKMWDITKILRGIKPLLLEPENFVETLNDEEIIEYKVEQLTDLITYSQEKNRIIYPDASIDKYVNRDDKIFLNIYEVLNTNGMRILFEEEKKKEINNLKLYSYLIKKSTNIQLDKLCGLLENTNYYFNKKNNNDANDDNTYNEDYSINPDSNQEDIITTNNSKDNINIKKNESNILSLREYMLYFPKEEIDKEYFKSRRIKTEYAIPIFHYYRSNKNSVYLFRDFYHAKISQFPVQYIILNNSYNISSRQLYEYVWYLNTLYMNHPNIKTDNFWWNEINKKDDNIIINNDNNNNLENKKLKRCFPFVLRYTEIKKEYEDYSSNLIHCGLCPWYSFCPGCIIDPNGEITNLNSNYGIVVDWCYHFINEEFIVTNFKLCKEIKNQVISENLPINKEQNYQSIEDCFDLFFVEENLEDPLYCHKCQGPESFTKKYSINRLPYVLILSLKRFKFNQNYNFKLSQMITYPLADLELKGEKYDLYGVINHYGGINSGHYTCIIKKKDKWYMCDDSNIYQIEEKRVMHANAYILFYINKESPYKNDYFRFMKSLMNNIILTFKDEKKESIKEVIYEEDKNYFRGEPVQTKEYGDGYVMQDNIINFTFDEKYDIYAELKKKDELRVEKIKKKHKEEEKQRQKEKEKNEDKENNENKDNNDNKNKEEDNKDNNNKENKEKKNEENKNEYKKEIINDNINDNKDSNNNKNENKEDKDNKIDNKIEDQNIQLEGNIEKKETKNEENNPETNEENKDIINNEEKNNENKNSIGIDNKEKKEENTINENPNSIEINNNNGENDNKEENNNLIQNTEKEDKNNLNKINIINDNQNMKNDNQNVINDNQNIINDNQNIINDNTNKINDNQNKINDNRNNEAENNNLDYYKNFVKIKFDYGEGMVYKTKVIKYNDFEQEKKRQEKEKEKQKQKSKKNKSFINFD